VSPGFDRMDQPAGPAAKKGWDLAALRALLLEQIEKKGGPLAESDRRRIESISSVGEIARLLATVRTGRPTPPALPARPVRIPLTFAQERLWLAYRLAPKSPAYNVPISFRLDGPLSPAALAAALGAIAGRQEGLRTSFPDEAGEPWQKIAPPSPVPLPLIDLGGLAAQRQGGEAARRTRDQALLPFVLETGPVMRFCLLRLGRDDHQLVAVFHHIAFDGWSAGILYAELLAGYGAAVGGSPPPLPALPAQLAETALDERRRLADGELAAGLEAWRRQLGGELPVLRLPFDRPRPAVPSHRGGAVMLMAPPGLAKGLAGLGRQHGATLFMVLLAGLKAMLLRFSSRESVLVGVEVSGRNRRESRGLIGFFVNFLLLHTDLSGDPTLAQVVARVRATALSGLDNQGVPYDRVACDLGLDRGAGRPFPFEVAFVLQSFPRGEVEAMPVTVSRVSVPIESSKFDLLIMAEEHGHDLQLSLVYSADLFERATVERLGALYLEVLAAFAADPAAHLSALGKLAHGEPSSPGISTASLPPQASGRRGARRPVLDLGAGGIEIVPPQEVS
jgi:hypothetical protein